MPAGKARRTRSPTSRRAEPAARVDRRSGGDKPRLRVLLIEDNAEVQSLVRDVLEDEGYRVTGVTNAAEARELLGRQRFDLVIADVVLPGDEDGIALANRAAKRGMPVAIITASRLLADRVEASGFPFLMKPFLIGDLTRLVREAVSKKGRLRAPTVGRS